MTENYDQQCLTDTLDQHSKTLERAVYVSKECQIGFSFGGATVGFIAGMAAPPGVQGATALVGAMAGTTVGQGICGYLSGVDEAVKPPSLTHCKTTTDRGR